MEGSTYDGQVRVYTLDGKLVAPHAQLAALEASILDGNYPTPQKTPSRGPKARTDIEKAFLELSEPAESIHHPWCRGGDDTAVQRSPPDRH